MELLEQYKRLFKNKPRAGDFKILSEQAEDPDMQSAGFTLKSIRDVIDWAHTVPTGRVWLNRHSKPEQFINLAKEMSQAGITARELTMKSGGDWKSNAIPAYEMASKIGNSLIDSNNLDDTWHPAEVVDIIWAFILAK
jgi:hypothetical protein